MAATVDIRDQVSEALAAFRENISAEKINPAIGRAEVGLFQKWFLSKPPNKLGWPTLGFWPDAARATNFTAIADGVVVSVNQIGVRQRLEGGEIHPTGGKKYLTIPARQEAYGRRAGEFNLQVLWSRSGGQSHPWALAEYAYTEIKLGKARKDGSRKVTQGEAHGAVMFWLVKSVQQDPDPTTLPPEELISAVAIETIEDAVDRAEGGLHH